MPTPYVVMADMAARMPAKHLVEALDDDGDGQVDPGSWDLVAAAVAKEIDGILGVRFAVPFSNPLPEAILTAAEIFALEILFIRRVGSSEQVNPFAAQAKQHRLTLAAMAKGERPLTPEITRARPSASIVGEPARTTSGKGRLTA